MAALGGAPATNAQQLNGLIAKDAEKQSVAVHSFNPDASPAEKAAAAGKGRSQLKSANDNANEPGGVGELSFVRSFSPVLSRVYQLPQTSELLAMCSARIPRLPSNRSNFDRLHGTGNSRLANFLVENCLCTRIP